MLKNGGKTNYRGLVQHNPKANQTLKSKVEMWYIDLRSKFQQVIQCQQTMLEIMIL